MALISKPNTFSAGTTILSADVNSDFDTIYNDYNGNITNANISASAAIDTSKISGTVVTRTANETISGNKVWTGTMDLQGANTISGAVTISGAPTITGVIQGATPLVFEGATADVHELSFAITDPTADRTVTFGNEDLNLAQQTIKGWVEFNGTGVIAVNDSFNVTSLTDNGTGDYTVNWTTAFSNANYSVAGMAQRSTTQDPGNVGLAGVTGPKAVGSVRVLTQNPGGGAGDSLVVSVIAIGDRV